MTADELMDKIKAMCDVMSAKEFESRLEGWILIYAYMGKRFEQRYPEEYKDYMERTDK